MVGQPAEQSPKHAAGECHQAAQPQQIAQQRGHKGHAHPVVRAQQHGAQDVDHVLYRGALAAKDGKAEHAAHHGKRAEHSRQSEFFSLRDFFMKMPPLQNTAKQKQETPVTVSPVKSISSKYALRRYDFLRRHYPHQVKGSKFGYFLSACFTSSPVFCVDAHILHPSAPNCKSRFAIQFPSGMLY